MDIIKTATILLITLIVVIICSITSWRNLTIETVHLLQQLVSVSVFFAIVTFITGTITNNTSQVDKLWSILPIGYVWYVTYMGEFSARLVIMSFLVTLWGIRLTYNFSLKKAYQWPPWKGEEDYRWKILREKKEFNPRWKWILFNLLFICLYQNLLILFFTLPIVIAFQHRTIPFGLGDILISLLMLGFILYETIADRQQWIFQKAKSQPNSKYTKGFLDQGLWAYSRHPNYFAEQMIWLSFYGFSIVASTQWINWSIIGCLLLMLLFLGSSNFSEEISASKYPEYKEYQKRVPRFIPWITQK